MTNRAAANKRAEANRHVSEYVWDPKTKRYKRNPDFKRNHTLSYIIWLVIVLVILLFVARFFN